jgi:hypothetical protein
MNAPATIALRFQRAELEAKADLSAAGLALLGAVPHPAQFLDALQSAGLHADAVRALALMLPHRQTVWWACLCVRLLPALARRPDELAAIEAAERWVQSNSAADSEQAGMLGERCDPNRAAAWAATAAYWAGPSLAPRGQQPVAPPPHLPGVATRSALILLPFDPALDGRLGAADLLEIGTALLHGENGRQAQLAVQTRLALA